MRTRNLLFFYICSVLAVLVSCSSSSDSIDNTAVNKSVLSGTGSKGPIVGGTVTAYALDDDGKTVAVLGSTTTDGYGSYSLGIGNYTGSILVELTGGNYIDEATGLTIGNSVLRAATRFVGDTVVAITPLTELAVRKAGALTATDIASANV